MEAGISPKKKKGPMEMVASKEPIDTLLRERAGDDGARQGKNRRT